MNLIYIGDYIINADKVLYVRRVDGDTIYVHFSADKAITMTGEEAVEFIRMYDHLAKP